MNTLAVDLRYTSTNQPALTYGTEGSAGLDLAADIDQPITLFPGQRKLINTGLSIHIKNPNYMAVIVPRSGLGHKNGLIMGNAVGIIDSAYTGELLISAWNSHETEWFCITPGMRIAQLIFTPITHAQFTVVAEHSNTVRGSGGFGSTGVNT
jgi:dUTP pyrophosphatase